MEMKEDTGEINGEGGKNKIKRKRNKSQNIQCQKFCDKIISYIPNEK